MPETNQSRRAGLLARRPEGRGYLPYQFGVLFLACAVLTFLCLLLSYAGYDAAVFGGYFEAPLIFLLNLLICFSLAVFLLGLCGRLWIAFLITSVLCLGVSLGNYYLILIRTDPLQFDDLLCLREALAITQKQQYSLDLSWRVVVSVLGAIGLTACLALLSRWKLRFKKEKLIVLPLGALLVGFCLFAVSSEGIFNATKHYDHINTWSTTQIYVSRGVLYSFLRSAMAGQGQKPSGYSAQAVEQKLASYHEELIPDDKKVTVIAVMRESYNDLSRLESRDGAIDWSCYDLYHALKDESYTGQLVTNGFGGNTKNAERCFLTGDYVLNEWRKPVNSYLWYLREQGYLVEGAHPFNGWFYNRKNVNRYLGFDDYLFTEECFGALTDAEVVPDSVLYDVIYQMLDDTPPVQPYFNFSVTFEGHGPYDYLNHDYGTRFVLEDPNSHDGTAMDNYLGCVYERDRELTAFVDRLRQLDRPVVLLTYGDHNPTLGSDINNYTTSAYESYGIDMDLSSEQGFLNYYATEYLIWANDAAKEALGWELSGKTGPTISPCYLMNVLFDALGWGRGPAYLQAMREYMDVFPVMSTNGRASVHGELVQTLEGQETIDAYHELQSLCYYWQKNFLYEGMTK